MDERDADGGRDLLYSITLLLLLLLLYYYYYYFVKSAFALALRSILLGCMNQKNQKKKQRSHLETKNTSLFLIVRVNIHTT